MLENSKCYVLLGNAFYKSQRQEIREHYANYSNLPQTHSTLFILLPEELLNISTSNLHSGTITVRTWEHFFLIMCLALGT